MIEDLPTATPAGGVGQVKDEAGKDEEEIDPELTGDHHRRERDPCAEKGEGHRRQQVIQKVVDQHARDGDGPQAVDGGETLQAGAALNGSGKLRLAQLTPPGGRPDGGGLARLSRSWLKGRLTGGAPTRGAAEGGQPEEAVTKQS